MHYAIGLDLSLSCTGTAGHLWSKLLNCLVTTSRLTMMFQMMQTTIRRFYVHC